MKIFWLYTPFFQGASLLPSLPPCPLLNPRYPCCPWSQRPGQNHSKPFLYLLPVIKLASLGLWGCVWSRSGRVYWEATVSVVVSIPRQHFYALCMWLLYTDQWLSYVFNGWDFVWHLVSPDVSQAAARHQCLYLVQQHSAGFLEAGGEESWLSGLEQAPTKLRSLQTLNKLLAHRPWLITQQHIQVRPTTFSPALSFAHSLSS